MQKIKESELILNPDGSIYHLKLKPAQISDTIIFVGDPDRVAQVSQYFDAVEFEIQHREFRTCTGIYKNKRLTVISTGIGTDNIDIVLNELDALVNINFDSRTVKNKLSKLKIIRIGTSGAVQSDIPVDSFLIATLSLGLDGLLHSYKWDTLFDTELEREFINQTQWDSKKTSPYFIEGNKVLIKKFDAPNIFKGCTATATGFYGPQGRSLRLPLSNDQFMDRMSRFQYNDIRITNFEMETSAIYGLSKLLGHDAISINAILANRATGDFSSNPKKTIDSLIRYSLDKLAQL